MDVMGHRCHTVPVASNAWDHGGRSRRLVGPLEAPQTMKCLLIVSALAVAGACAGTTVACATTPVQSAAAEARARAALLAKNKSQTEATRKATAVLKQQAEAAAGAKSKVQTKLSVEAEVRRRIEAADKAAKVNAKIVAATPVPSGGGTPKATVKPSGPTAAGAPHPQRPPHRADRPPAHAK